MHHKYVVNYSKKGQCRKKKQQQRWSYAVVNVLSSSLIYFKYAGTTIHNINLCYQETDY